MNIVPAPVMPKLLKKIALNGLNFKFEIFFAYGAYLRRLMHNNHNWWLVEFSISIESNNGFDFRIKSLKRINS